MSDATRRGGDAVREAILQSKGLRADDARAFSEAAIAVCRQAYDAGKAFDALPLSRAVIGVAKRQDDSRLVWRTYTAAGIIACDSGDYADALTHHGEAIALARDGGTPIDEARAWNNSGLVFLQAAIHDLGAECFQAAARLAPEGDYLGYIVPANLAQCFLHLGHIEAGLDMAARAIAVETDAFIAKDPTTSVTLRADFARLLLRKGDFADAARRVQEAEVLAARNQSPRSAIAASVARGQLLAATGKADSGIARLEDELAKARRLPAALVDTLATLIQAEKSAGRPARAALYVQQLDDYFYEKAVMQTRRHLEVSSHFVGLGDGTIPSMGEGLPRLKKYSDPVPEWDTFERFALRAGLQRGEPKHGRRVGDLAHLLSIEAGYEADFAKEIGLACRVHDIGYITMPTALLGKRKPHSTAAIAISNEHPIRGREILEESTHPRALLAADIAQYHHERWDGQGYPDRLRGEAIPRPARICAVVQGFDDVWRERGTSAAIAHVQEGSGRLYDPRLALTLCVSAAVGLISAHLKDAKSDDSRDVETLLRHLGLWQMD